MNRRGTRPRGCRQSIVADAESVGLLEPDPASARAAVLMSRLSLSITPVLYIRCQMPTGCGWLAMPLIVTSSLNIRCRP